MRTVLVGAVESTHVALETLAELACLPSLLITLPGDSRRHSDMVDLTPTATRLGVPVLQTAKANGVDVMVRLRELKPRYVYVIGWSELLKQDFLSIPDSGCIGFHPAPLPLFRGRGVIPWTILRGNSETGSTLFWLDEGMDSGDILGQEMFPVAEDETARTLYNKHMRALRRLLIDVVPLLASEVPPRLGQNHDGATYCARRTPDDGYIDWSRSAREVWTLVRAVGEPYPGAITHRGRAILRIWSADYLGGLPYIGLPGQVQEVDSTGAIVQCGDGEHIRLRIVQREDSDVAEPGTVLKRHERLGMPAARAPMI